MARAIEPDLQRLDQLRLSQRQWLDRLDRRQETISPAAARRGAHEPLGRRVDGARRRRQRSDRLPGQRDQGPLAELTRRPFSAR